LSRPTTFALSRFCAVAALLVLGAARSAAAAEPIEKRIAPCLACHGANGTSQTPLVPSLGGQPEFFLTVQLLMFRDKLRVVAPMNEMLSGLTDADLKAMAAYFSKLPPPLPPAGAVDSGRMERARAVIEQQRCNFCHGATYGGGDDDPRLAGQREDYLAKALADYKNNTRRGYDASMADVLYPIGDEQLLDLAYFLARQR
jgi:cytochrome c553